MGDMGFWGRVLLALEASSWTGLGSLGLREVRRRQGGVTSRCRRDQQVEVKALALTQPSPVPGALPEGLQRPELWAGLCLGGPALCAASASWTSCTLCSGCPAHPASPPAGPQEPWAGQTSSEVPALGCCCHIGPHAVRPNDPTYFQQSCDHPEMKFLDDVATLTSFQV